MTTRMMAAAVRLSGPPEVIVLRRTEPTAASNIRRGSAMGTVDLIDTDRGGKPYLIRFFRELR